MPRYKLTIEYDGSPFFGWQVQEDHLSVAGVLEDSVEKLSGERVKVSGAGRTDAGVHALGQVAHIDLAKDWETDVIRDGLNAHLRPHPVAILSAEKVGDDFDARFSATKRHYVYRILNRRADLALDRSRVWRVARPLDEQKMREAAQHLLGNHDFTTFRSTECQAKSPVKTLEVLNVTRDGQEIRIEASARSFLHNQVRSIVGSLEQVAEGRWSPADMKRALDARDRAACGPVAPPDGLYLLRVNYEK
jgi:tRNA pseudouridine38-40 synthase